MRALTRPWPQACPSSSFLCHSSLFLCPCESPCQILCEWSCPSLLAVMVLSFWSGQGASPPGPFHQPLQGKGPTPVPSPRRPRPALQSTSSPCTASACQPSPSQPPYPPARGFLPSSGREAAPAQLGEGAVASAPWPPNDGDRGRPEAGRHAAAQIQRQMLGPPRVACTRPQSPTGKDKAQTPLVLRRPSCAATCDGLRFVTG